MATEVGLMARFISGYGKEAEAKGEKDPITRDLLGGCPVMDAKDLDLGLGIGSGSTKDKAAAFDILPGKIFLKSNHSTKSNPLQDLNLPPATISLQIPDSSPKSNLAVPNTNYQSVCTIEKVKFALERMGRESHSKSHAQSDGSPSPSSSSITSHSPLKRQRDLVDGCDSSAPAPVGGASMMAAACPKCLLYVLISKENPRCPQCNSHVPPAVLSSNNNSNKKPRINRNSRTLDLF